MENQTEKIYPYQKLLRENNIEVSDLDRGTQQMISDLKKTLNMLYAQSQRKGVTTEVSANTQNKIETYDRHICNDILDYLDELEEKQEEQIEVKQVVSSSQSHSQTTNSQTTKQVTNESESNDSEKSGSVGFWNWE
jgi:septal ring factor EnvC (AmiA/AmiB activator)